jgi:ABC-2 type transport system permease protein
VSAISRPAPAAVLRVTLAMQRRSLLWWSIGIVVTALMFAAIYPSVRDSAQDFDRFFQDLPEALRNLVGQDIGSPIGYLQSRLFNVTGPVLLLIFTIGQGARAIAGEEEDGSLDLMLATPLRRRTVLRDRAAAMLAGTALLSAVLLVALVAIGRPFGLDVGIGVLGAAVAMQGLLALAFGAIALAIGAVTGRRSFATSGAGGFAAFSYLAYALAPTLEALAPVRPVLPFRWYLDPEPLRHGFEPANALVLIAVAAVAYTVANVGLERRDLAT